MTGRLIAAALAAALVPAGLVGQGPVFSGGGSVANVRTRRDTTVTNGATLGVTGTVRLGRVDLEVRYAEGTLQPARGNAVRREVIEGAVTLHFHALAGVALFVGPHARRYDKPTEDLWVTWQAGVRAATPIVGTALHGHVVLWRGLSTSLNTLTASAQGGEVGARLELPAAPLSFTLAYAIDQAEVGGNRETVEGLILTAVLRRK